MDQNQPSNLNPYNIEDSLAQIMEASFQLAKMMNPGVNDYALRCKISSLNLKALAHVILMADDPSTDLQLNVKQVVLGLLATSDWLDPGDDFYVK